MLEKVEGDWRGECRKGSFIGPARLLEIAGRVKKGPAFASALKRSCSFAKKGGNDFSFNSRSISTHVALIMMCVTTKLSDFF